MDAHLDAHLHADDNVYDSLAEAIGGQERWAFGTGFDDPLAGVDTAVPAGVDAAALGRECLALGDDALLLSQRLALWVSNAPELEDEVALANIALDLLGQARLLLTRAAQADPGLRPAAAPAQLPDEDALAYFREPVEFRNVRLVEIDDGLDFARCIARLFLATAWRLPLLHRVGRSSDPVLAAIAAKGVIEATYHQEYAAGWLVRLGDGTALSHQRMQAAVEWAWPYAAELSPETGVAEVVADTLAAATLRRPEDAASPPAGEERDRLLTELQSFARANTDATW